MELEKPFSYEIIDNFLPNEELSIIRKAYSSLVFKEIQTDLYNFLQSNELDEDDQFAFFKKRLDDVLVNRISEKDTFYTFFASYYRKDDFLLCHDDMVDERLYAFTFYLDTFKSGQLVLYENDCETVHQKVDVRGNRLVIFKVGENSFHEVDSCQQDGRMAVSGWINSKSKKNLSKDFHQTHKIFKNIHFFDLNIDVRDLDGFIGLEFQDSRDASSRMISRRLCGPFVDRRVFEVLSSMLYVPQFDGYELISTEHLFFDKNCYILYNDKVNQDVENILDVFIFNCEGGVDCIPDFISYIGQDSKISFKIDAIDSYMLIGRRNGYSICILRSPKNIYLKHFIYKTIN